MLLIQVLLIQVSTIIIFDNLYVQNQSTTTAQALARTKTRMTTWLNSNFRGRWKEVSGPNVTLASNQWMIVMRIGKQGGNYDYHYWYRTNDGPWANKHGQTPSVLLPASDMPTTNSSSGWTLNGKTGFYNSSIVYCQLLSEYVISCACVPLCYTGAFCFGCFGTNWCCWQRVPSRFMRKIICRLRLSEVSRQYPECSLYYGKTPTIQSFPVMLQWSCISGRSKLGRSKLHQCTLYCAGEERRCKNLWFWVSWRCGKIRTFARPAGSAFQEQWILRF